MHAMMEDYIKHCIENNDSKPDKNYKNGDKVQILVDWSVENVDVFVWSEAHCYSRELWLGGISDCGFKDKKGKYAILDFKSGKEAYTSQFWQCIGYGLQIEENGLFDKDGNLVFTLDKPISYVAVLPFGMDKPEVQYYHDMEDGKRAVRAMITLYNLLNK